MLTENECLLISLIEEQAEVIQRLCKALRFGLYEVQPGQELTNRERIHREMADVVGVTDLLRWRGVLMTGYDCEGFLAKAKREKVMQFMEYSQELGIVEPSSSAKDD